MSQHKAELKQCTQKMQWLGCELGNSILLRRVVSLSQTNPYPGHWSSLSCSVTHCSSNPRGTLQAACSQCSLSLALQLPLPAPWEGHTPLQLLQGWILAVYSQRLTQWFSPGRHHLCLHKAGPIMNSDQAAQGCLNSWSPPWEAVQCGTEHDKPQDKRYPGFQPCLPLHTGCTATPFYKATVHNHYQNIPCSTLLHKHYVKEKDIMSQLKSIIICMDLSNTFDLSSSLQQR